MKQAVTPDSATNALALGCSASLRVSESRSTVIYIGRNGPELNPTRRPTPEWHFSPIRPINPVHDSSLSGAGLVRKESITGTDAVSSKYHTKVVLPSFASKRSGRSHSRAERRVTVTCPCGFGGAAPHSRLTGGNQIPRRQL